MRVIRGEAWRNGILLERRWSDCPELAFALYLRRPGYRPVRALVGSHSAHTYTAGCAFSNTNEVVMKSFVASCCLPLKSASACARSSRAFLDPRLHRSDMQSHGSIAGCALFVDSWPT